MITSNNKIRYEKYYNNRIIVYYERVPKQFIYDIEIIYISH